MSYTTQKTKENKWEVRLGGKLIFTTDLEDVADDFAIAMGAARHERIRREKVISNVVGNA